MVQKCSYKYLELLLYTMPNTIVQQLLVGGSTLLAALPVGSSVNFPSVLLHQLSSNESSIQLDWDTASWIGAIHGIAAIPSILMPAFMQWRGRKLAFIFACLISIIGWIIAFTATSSTSILISESLHGFGSQSIMAVGLLSMSEMLSPRMRTISMGFYSVMQTLGIALVGMLGNYLHWKTVTLVVCVPLSMSVIGACIWPESPSWLASKGEFDKCSKAFMRLRGTGDVALTELEELISAQKENLSRDSKRNKQHLLKAFWQTLKSRDFYLPGIHIFALLYSVYWSGGLAVMIYSSEIFQRATFTRDAVLFGNMILNIMLIVGCITSIVLVRYFQPKIVLLGMSLCAVAGLLCASGINYLQTAGLMTKDTYICLYMLIWFMFATNTCSPIILTVTAELMPVKHRGIGGPLYVSIACIMHTSLMKISPYMLKHINLWGMLLIFAVNGFLANLFIWQYVPETKGRTLQQLEDYYAYGRKYRSVDVKADLQELIAIEKFSEKI